MNTGRFRQVAEWNRVGFGGVSGHRVPGQGSLIEVYIESDNERYQVYTRSGINWVSRARSGDHASDAWTMCSNSRHRITTSSAEPAKPNQNGAVMPNVRASRPPIGVPTTIPPITPTV